MRPLVKGIFRIAFQSQEEYKDKPHLKIIPVCLDYENYPRFRATQYIEFGKPIEVSEYYNSYKENPAIGMNQLKDRLSMELKKMIVHVENEEYYDFYKNCMQIIYNELQSKRKTRLRTLKEKLQTDKKLIEILDSCQNKSISVFNDLKEKVSQYKAELKKRKINDKILSKKIKFIGLSVLFHILKLVLGLPVFLFGYIFSFIPYIITKSFTNKKIKDTQFKSSIKYAMGLILSLVYMLLLLPLAIIFLKNFILVILFYLLFPACGIFAYQYYLY